MSVQSSEVVPVDDRFNPDLFELLPQEQDQLNELQSAAKDTEHAEVLRRLFVTNLASRLNLF